MAHKNQGLLKQQSIAHGTSVPGCLSASQCAYSGPKLNILLNYMKEHLKPGMNCVCR